MSDKGEGAQTTQTGFARWLVWLFTGIGVLAALAVIALAALVFSTIGDRAPREPANVAGAAAAPPLEVLKTAPLRGTSLIAVTIGHGGSGRGSSPYGISSGGEEDRRNIVLLDSRTGENRRLLADNDHRILQSMLLPAQAGASDATDDGAVFEVAGSGDNGEKKPQPTLAYYAVTIARAKDGPVDVLVGALATGAQGFVLTGVDGVDRIWMQSETHLALLYRQRLKLHYRVIDMPTLKTIVAHPVEIG